MESDESDWQYALQLHCELNGSDADLSAEIPLSLPGPSTDRNTSILLISDSSPEEKKIQSFAPRVAYRSRSPIPKVVCEVTYDNQQAMTVIISWQICKP